MAPRVRTDHLGLGLHAANARLVSIIVKSVVLRPMLASPLYVVCPDAADKGLRAP